MFAASVLSRVFGAVAVMAFTLSNAPGAAREHPAVTDKDEGKLIEREVGEEIVFRFPEQISTGYAWKVVERPKLVEQVSTRSIAGEAPGLAGGPEIREIRYKVLKSGEEELKFASCRRTPKPGDPTIKFKIKVK